MLTNDTLKPTIVVDASGDPISSQKPWYQRLRTSYPLVDSVEADPRVRVFRFPR